jgi:hypothetical protein
MVFESWEVSAPGPVKCSLAHKEAKKKDHPQGSGKFRLNPDLLQDIQP